MNVTVICSNNINGVPLLSVQAITNAKETPTASPFGVLITPGVDIGDTFTYTLLDNAGGRFQLGASSCTLLNFEAQVTHTIRVQRRATRRAPRWLSPLPLR